MFQKNQLLDFLGMENDGIDFVQFLTWKYNKTAALFKACQFQKGLLWKLLVISTSTMQDEHEKLFFIVLLGAYCLCLIRRLQYSFSRQILQVIPQLNKKNDIFLHFNFSNKCCCNISQYLCVSCWSSWTIWGRLLSFQIEIFPDSEGNF